MCTMHVNNDKVQTKLNILHTAVNVINKLEKQVESEYSPDCIVNLGCNL